MPYSALALGQQGLRLRPRRARSDRSHRLPVRLAVAMVVVASLVGFVGATFRAPTAAGTGPTRIDQQRYLRALSPISVGIDQSSKRMGLAAALYATQDIDRAELKARVEAALAAYRRAQDDLGSLEPPPELEVVRQGYVDAVRTFQLSALELLKVADDGDEPHLTAATSLMLDGSARLHGLLDRFWPARVG